MQSRILRVNRRLVKVLAEFLQGLQNLDVPFLGCKQESGFLSAFRVDVRIQCLSHIHFVRKLTYHRGGLKAIYLAEEES